MYSSWTHITLTHHHVFIKVTQPSLSQIIYTQYIFESHNLLNSQKPFSQLILKRIPNHAFSKPSIVMLTPYLEFIRCGTHFTIHVRDPLHYSHAGPTSLFTCGTHSMSVETLIGQNFPCHLTQLSNNNYTLHSSDSSSNLRQYLTDRNGQNEEFRVLNLQTKFQLDPTVHEVEITNIRSVT